MMEKDSDYSDLDNMLKDWTDNLLSAEEDRDLTDRLIGFAEEDTDIGQTDTGIEEILEAHIHRLALEERAARNRRIKVAVISSAASLALLVSAAAFLLRENISVTETSVPDTSLMAVRTETAQPAPAPEIATAETPEAESIAKASAAKKPQRSTTLAMPAKDSGSNGNDEYLAEATPAEKEIAAAIAGIDFSLSNLFGTTFEDISLAEAEIIPKKIFSENESVSTGEAGKAANTLETNLITTLHEMKRLNINLNFETN
ncbi:MAG: hypothetical protein Q4C37_04205 [Bacteroidales bacterium]|nr:hypothetical protein [Bacteroidales bacterium]